MSKLMDAWKAGDAPTVERIVLSALKQEPQLYQRLLVDRNKTWIPKLEALFARKGRTFVVVGKLFVFWGFGLYHKLWRFTDGKDFEAIVRAVVVASFVLVVAFFLIPAQAAQQDCPCALGPAAVMIRMPLDLRQQCIPDHEIRRLHPQAEDRMPAAGRGHR